MIRLQFTRDSDYPSHVLRWQWHRTGSHWSPNRTLPVAPLWCDLRFFPNSRGNKAAANLRPKLVLKIKQLEHKGILVCNVIVISVLGILVCNAIVSSVLWISKAAHPNSVRRVLDISNMNKYGLTMTSRAWGEGGEWSQESWPWVRPWTRSERPS